MYNLGVDDFKKVVKDGLFHGFVYFAADFYD